MTKLLLPVAIAACLLVSTAASAQTTPIDSLPGDPGPRRQFFTLSLDGMNTMPLHFKEYPLEQLIGQELSELFNEEVDYRSSDGATTIDVLKFNRRNFGAGLTVYPLGAGNGTSLAIRGSIEHLPEVRLNINGPRGSERYRLTDGRALDIGVGMIVSDRSTGWGLGSHTFVLGGVGRIRGERGGGSRFFGEGGGGLNWGPIGVQISVKVAYNRLEDPRAHNFLTVPISVRGTLSF